MAMVRTLFIVFCSIVLSEQQKRITLEDILQGTYQARGFSGNWISDTELQYISGVNVVATDIITNKTRTVIEGSLFDEQSYPGRSLSLSADNNFILVTHSRRQQWRQSFFAKYHIYDKLTREIYALSPPGSPDPEPELQLVRWSPVGNALVYVHNNNLHYLTSAAKGANTVLLTKDGSNTIFNGHTDWVYEEEMFLTPNALWFSPTGTHLAFVKFNDSAVDEMQFPLYGEPGDQEAVMPTWVHFRYPKAGKTNPTANMYLVDLRETDNPNPIKVSYQGVITPDEHTYIGTASWRNATDLILIHLNRKQEQAIWYTCNIASSGCTEIWREIEMSGWIDPPGWRGHLSSSDGTHILTLSSTKTSGAFRSYRHIVKITDRTSEHINHGNFSIDSIIAWDESTNRIYFAGSSATNPSESQIYSVTGNSYAECITCTLRNSHDEKCQANSASFSHDLTYFLHFCSGPNVPEVAVRVTTTANSIKRVVEDNLPIRQALVGVDVPIVQEFFEIPLPGGYFGRARLYLPPDFDENKKYPLLMDVYGGPDAQDIKYGYGFDWGSSLVSDKNIIYGLVDGRGSGRQSREQIFELKHRFGTVEVQDGITMTKWLIDNTKYIDPNQTAIWGWSYGGYNTAMVMAKDTDQIFKCGISVAPVTNFMYQDTIYTERFMGLPTIEDNLSGYQNADVTIRVDNFRNKKFLLVHGNADDNVHYQHSMVLARSLEKADIMFTQLSYPNEGHELTGEGMHRHLYHSLEKFLFPNCFKDAQIPSENSSNIFTSVRYLVLVVAFVAYYI